MSRRILPKTLLAGLLLSSTLAIGAMPAVGAETRLEAFAELPEAGPALHVRIAGDLAFVPAHARGTHIVDISEPARPRLLATAPTAGAAYEAAVLGDRLYVAAWSAGLEVFDIGDPAAPRLLGSAPTRANAQAVAVLSERYVVTGDWSAQAAEANDFAHRWLFTNTVSATVDPQGRWVNGTIGKITFLDEEGFGEGSVEVKIQGGNIVEVKPVTWEMFRFFFNEDTQGIESEVVGSFSQLPLKLAWAVTIHKSQGKTFDKVIIDIGNGTFSHGQIYVAMSRCTTFEGIVLRKPIYDHHVLLDPRVVEYMSANQCS